MKRERSLAIIAFPLSFYSLTGWSLLEMIPIIVHGLPAYVLAWLSWSSVRTNTHTVNSEKIALVYFLRFLAFRLGRQKLKFAMISV